MRCFEEAAEQLGVAPRLVQAAVEYYAEVDEDAEAAEVAEGTERTSAPGGSASNAPWRDAGR